ncbi:MAG: hypothetical protein NTZ67_08375 [Gammaproteobacteria bacterium]|nr:hypothetical protein [Gammaproteobacteria bacterium]
MTALKQFQILNSEWVFFSETRQYYFQIAHWKVCFSFASHLLSEKIIRAFNHLVCKPADNPDLTICFWDTTEAQRLLPNLEWELIYRNGSHGYHESGIYFHYCQSVSALSAINLKTNRAYYVVQNSNALPWWTSGSPLQVIINVWMSANHFQLTHTAAVGNTKSSVLLTGKGGSGKSTTTLACVRNGLNYLGEDYCILEPGTIPAVHSIYQSAKWALNTRKLFPDYENFIANPIEAKYEKALVYYQDFFPNQIKNALPISAIVSLKVCRSQTPVLKKHEKILALKDLMMSTLSQLPFSSAKTIKNLKKIIFSVPCYQLMLSENMQANVDFIKTLL